ncbi:MAG: cupin domain-containing protein, partial [bacterium]
GKFDEPNDRGGWSVGSFFDDNHPCKTDNIEVLYKEHKPGDICKPHYHKQKVELLLMLEGKARYVVNDNEVVLKTGNFLFVDVNNVISGEFLKPSKILAIHSPSIITDKVELD